MLQRFQAFVTGITECHRYIQRIKSMEMTELGLKGTHVMCLFYLNQTPAGLTAAQLCQLCAEDKAAVSRTVSELEGNGYLALPDGKKYRAPLQLTSKGREAAQKIDALVAQWVCIGGDGLTDEERTAFYATLDKIAANLKSKVEKGF